MRLVRLVGFLIALGSGLAAGAASGEWLVLRDGTRLETAGPYSVKGRLVVFKSKQGTLASLRWDEVDEPATVEANRPRTSAAPEAAKDPTPKTPVRVLREEDLPKARPAASAAPAAGEAPGVTAGDADTTTRAKQVEIVDWERATVNEGADTEIVGTLRNDTDQTALVRGVRVSVFDADGRLLATTDGMPRAPQLPPGQTTSFRATLVGVPSFAAARFRVEASAAENSPRRPGSGDAGARQDRPAPGTPPPAGQSPPR